MKNNEIKLADYLGCKENEVFKIDNTIYKVKNNNIYFKFYDDWLLDSRFKMLNDIKELFTQYLIVRKLEYCKAFDNYDRILTYVKNENKLFHSQHTKKTFSQYQKLFTKQEIEELKEKLNIELYEYDIIPLCEYENKIKGK